MLEGKDAVSASCVTCTEPRPPRTLPVNACEGTGAGTRWLGPGLPWGPGSSPSRQVHLLQPHGLQNLCDGATRVRRRGHSWPHGLFQGRGKAAPFSPGGLRHTQTLQPPSHLPGRPPAAPVRASPPKAHGKEAFHSPGLSFPTPERRRRGAGVLAGLRDRPISW